MPKEHRHYNVIKGLLEVATVVGRIQDVPVMLRSGEEGTPDLGLTASADMLLDRIISLQEKCLQIAVVGAVSRGKSTLINAILGEHRLPDDMEACTGVITQVIYGTNVDEVTLVEKDQRRMVPHTEFLNTVRLTSEEHRSIKTGEAFEMPERLTHIDYAVLEADYRLGESGLYLVDTPGFRAGKAAEDITKNFLAKTDALLFVTRAQPLFEEEDEEFLTAQLRHNESSLEHIFFVINDFSGLDIPRRAEVKRNARTRLKDYFLTLDGEFDEALFERRVFIVDARAALEARANGKVGDALEATGLPMLERGIQQMLDDEKLLPMVLEGTTTQVLIPTLEEASRSIQQEKGLLSKDLSELERTQHEVEEHLVQLTNRTRHIRDTFNHFAQKIRNRAADHFADYATRMIDTWNADWETLNIGEMLRLKDVTVATLSSRKKEELTAELGDRIGHYLERKMSDWETEVLQHLEQDMAEMSTALEEEVQDFVVKLDEIRSAIVAHEMPEFLNMDQQRGRKVAQILYGVLAFDSNQITGSLMDGSWKGFFGRIVSQIVAVNIAVITAAFIAGPVGLIVGFSVLITEMLLVHVVGRRSMLSNVRDRIGSELRTKLVDAAPDIKSEIQQSIGSQFETYSDSLLSTLQTEIDQVTAQLNNVLANKQAGEEAVTAERSRLDVVEANLNRGFEQVSHEVYGRTLTPEEHERLRQGNALLSENA
jgi:GTPase SAR1 family protein